MGQKIPKSKKVSHDVNVPQNGEILTFGVSVPTNTKRSCLLSSERVAKNPWQYK